jgi:hypothetical protein
VGGQIVRWGEEGPTRETFGVRLRGLKKIFPCERP